MDAIERRALYHLLRMNWLNDPTMSVEPWQVEDYRAFSLPTLFERLKSFDIQLDNNSFIAYANECDSPEDLTDYLIGDRTLSNLEEDQIYLTVFDLWRRLLTEKPSLTIICDELDHQMYRYDQQQPETIIDLQKALTHFIRILEENVDQGVAPQEALRLLSPYCANDLETFLFDFMSDQLDEEHEVMVQDLIDELEPYTETNKWFKLLRIRLFDEYHHKIRLKLVEEIIEEHLNEEDLDYNIELLALLCDKNSSLHFISVANHTFSLLKQEDDFQDLLSLLIEYFHLQCQKRKSQRIDQPIKIDDLDIRTIKSLLD